MKKKSILSALLLGLSLSSTISCGNFLSFNDEAVLNLPHNYLVDCLGHACNRTLTKADFKNLLLYVETSEHPHDIACVTLAYILEDAIKNPRNNNVLITRLYNALFISRSKNRQVISTLTATKKLLK